MKQVIAGLTYDTAKSELLGRWRGSENDDRALWRTPNGRYFISIYDKPTWWFGEREPYHNLFAISKEEAMAIDCREGFGKFPEIPA